LLYRYRETGGRALYDIASQHVKNWFHNVQLKHCKQKGNESIKHDAVNRDRN